MVRKLFLLFVAFFLILPFVNAETGSINIDDVKVLSYFFGIGGGGQTTNFSQIFFDINDFNSIQSFHIKDTSLSFNTQFESTTFIISGGGTGSGITWYDKNFSSVYYAFDPGAIITASPFNITLSNNIYANIISGASDATTRVINQTQPVLLKSSVPTNAAGGTYGSVTVSRTATDNYEITYPVANFFSINITKNIYVPSKYFIHGSNVIYSQETNFSKYNVTGAVFQNTNGIYLNVTLVGGYYKDVLINATNSNIPTPIPTPVINSTTGKGIVWQNSSYAIGNTGIVSWAIGDSIWNLFSQQAIDIRKEGVDGVTNRVRVADFAPQTGTYNYTFSECTNGEVVCGEGIYDAILYTNLLGFLETNREVASTSVFPAYAYINAPSVVNEGQTINVNYKFGTTTNNGFLIDDKLDDFGISTFTPIYHNLSCLCGVSPNSTSLMFTGIGKHRLILFDATTLNNVATQIITVLASDTIIGQNITSNYFSIDKANYNLGDTIYGQYQISTLNWSSYPYITSTLTSASNISMGNVKLTSQTGTFELPIDATQINFIQSGQAYVNLSAKTSVFNTTDNILASIPITITVSKNGWSIIAAKQEVCNGDTFSVDYTSPTGTGILNVSYYSNSNTNKYLTFPFSQNGSKKISISDAHINAGVALDLFDNSGNFQIGTIIKIVDTGCQVTSTPTPGITAPGEGWGNPTDTNSKSHTVSLLDGYVGTMGYGINNNTRLMFSVIVIMLFIVLAALATKGNAIVAVAAGFIPFAFFASISLDSGAQAAGIEFMPKWAVIMFIILLALSVKIFR